MDLNAGTMQTLIARVKPDHPAPAAIVAGEVSADQAPHPLSVFDMFRIGIGPSSSHTVGPMRAGLAFATELAALCVAAAEKHSSRTTQPLLNSITTPENSPTTRAQDLDRNSTDTVDQLPPLRVSVPETARIDVELFGSLGATGRGHNTDRAVLLGLAGFDPQTFSIDTVESLIPAIARTGHLKLAGGTSVPFDIQRDLRFVPRTRLPYHVNALTISAFDSADSPLLIRTYYSVGGGFVMAQTNDDVENPAVTSLASPEAIDVSSKTVPYPFASGAELLERCQASGLSISGVMLANELAMRPSAQVEAYMDRIANTMFECIHNGVQATGILPGGLDVPRRAHTLSAKLHAHASGHPGVDECLSWGGAPTDPIRAMDWVNLFALAVNEENAAGHRIVTAPTNGAAGVVPAVLGYLVNFCPEAGVRLPQFAPTLGQSLFDFAVEDVPTRRKAVHRFLLAAAAIGALIKTNASIAGAEVGCQGEVGSASAMAAAGLAEALDGSAEQVENAAEIAMEHSLGLTCDPVGGLVQIPCIERNAIAAVKAINAARMALWGDGRHTVSLDAVIETMRQTGNDMLSKYKETSAGGLAVNVVEC